MSPTSYQTAPPRSRNDSGRPPLFQLRVHRLQFDKLADKGNALAVNSDFSLTPEYVNKTVRGHWEQSPHECVEISPTHALARQVIEQDTLRPGGFVPGPIQFSIADLVLWYVTFAALGRVEPMALTSELSIRFLRPAQGNVMWARADIDKAGRTSVVGTVKIWMDDRCDRLVSTAQGTYVYPRRA